MMEPIDCPETSVRNYHFTLRKIPPESTDLIYTAAKTRNHAYATDVGTLSFKWLITEKAKVWRKNPAVFL
jgi:hypothetical protein